MKNLLLLLFLLIPIFVFSQTTLENKDTDAIYKGNIVDSYKDGIVFVDKEKGLIFLEYEDLKQDLSGLTNKKFDFSPGKEIEKGAKTAILGVLIPVITTSAALFIQNGSNNNTLFGKDKQTASNYLIIGGSVIGLVINVSGFSRIAKGGQYMDIKRI